MEQSSIKGKSLINEKLAKLSSFKELTFFFLKYSFQFKKILGSLFFAIIVFVGCVAEVPYYYAFSATLNFSLFLISAMIYGSIFFVFRKSTIFENVRQTNLNKKKIYLAIFISMFLFTGMVYLFLISIFSISVTTNLPFLMDDWFFSTSGLGEGGLFIKQLNVQLIFWWYIAFILLNFGLFYLFQNISNTKKTFFLFIFTYLILLIIYGGTLNPPAVWRNYENFYNQNPKLMSILSEYFGLTNGEISILFSHFHAPVNISLTTNLKTKYQNGHYISTFFSIVVPHYWINTFCANIWRCTALKIETITLTTPATPWTNEKIFSLPILFQHGFLKNVSIWKIKGQIWWSLGMYLWIFYFGFLYLIGTIFSRFKNFKN